LSFLRIVILPRVGLVFEMIKTIDS
jgi:hypothetical protein